MSNKNILRLLILGGILVAGIIFIQGYWATRNWQLKDIEFNQQVHIVLRQVAEKLSTFNDSKLPKQNLIQRRSSNLYAVNINDEIDANILEDFLITEFEKQSMNTDFEYAVYDCTSDEMVYGNYCDIGEQSRGNVEEQELPKFQGLEYYFVVRFPSKTSFLLRSVWQSILFSGITLLALGFFIYTTSLILRQKKLSEMQKDFINNMTHEFKTPISSMKIAADVLAGDNRIKNDERLKNYVGIIKNQNVRLNAQVEKVLDIARIEKEALKLKKETVNLSELLKETATNFELKAKELGGEFSMQLTDSDLFVFADKLHLGNVIYNILDNAFKYYVDVPKVNIQLKGGEHPALIVQDEGIGIPEQHLNNLFDKFFRVPTGNVHNVKGFGLGLFYVKTICDAHHWKIKINSRVDKGTEFIIKFKT